MPLDLDKQMELEQAVEIIGRVVENPAGSHDVSDRELGIAVATVLVRNGLLGRRADA